MSGRRCTVGDLIEAGLLQASDVLNRGQPQKGATHYATVLANGDLRFEDGRQFSSPTAAATLAARHSVPDGWTVWRLPDGRSLADLRELLPVAEHGTPRERGPARRPFDGSGESKITGGGPAGDLSPAPLLVSEVEEHPAQSPSRRSEPSRWEPLSASSSAEWVPAGQSIEVDGRIITGGLVYVGSGEPSVDGGEIEPCLIDPALPVEWSDPDWWGETIYRLPSYDGIDPHARAAYLSWLAHGRCAEYVYIGFVFLFYYGLERRLLADLDQRPDDPAVTPSPDREFPVGMVQVGMRDFDNERQHMSDELGWGLVRHDGDDRLGVRVRTQMPGLERITAAVGLGAFQAAAKKRKEPARVGSIRSTISASNSDTEQVKDQSRCNSTRHVPFVCHAPSRAACYLATTDDASSLQGEVHQKRPPVQTSDCGTRPNHLDLVHQSSNRGRRPYSPKRRQTPCRTRCGTAPPTAGCHRPSALRR